LFQVISSRYKPGLHQRTEYAPKSVHCPNPGHLSSSFGRPDSATKAANE
jgi:hypothetical protein